VTALLEPHAGQRVVREGVPLAEARSAVIMIHGRGARPESILELVPHIGHSRAAYLAPAASNGTWYPKSFLSPIEENEPGISSGIAVVHSLIDEVVAAGIPADRLMLVGFSQGACLMCTAAQRRPDRYGGVIAFSGGLIGPPGTTWSEDGSFQSTPVFFGCSDQDAHVPETRVRESAAAFMRMGADVTTRIYPGMGHLVNDDELMFARELLSRLSA
jgi:predicted esterase